VRPDRHIERSERIGPDAARLGRRWAALLVFLLGVAPHAVDAQGPAGRIEDKLKAVYILNFLRYAEWPDSTFQDAHSPLVVGVLGEDPLAAMLEETMRLEEVQGRPVTVRRLSSGDGLAGCHAVYLGASERRNRQAALRRASAALTISDADGFGSEGVCISFFLEENKLRFEVDMEAMRRSALKMSSKLLRLARITNPQ
jgi:hypothetical protein